MAKDANVPDLVRKLMSTCPSQRCPMRDPVYRDLTGDGRDELIVAVDDPGLSQTMLQVYRASGDEIRPVLIHWAEPGLTGETLGKDLVVTANGKEGPYTTRYRWNGKVLAPVGVQGRDGAPQEGATQDSRPADDGAVDDRGRTDRRTTS